MTDEPGTINNLPLPGLLTSTSQNGTLNNTFTMTTSVPAPGCGGFTAGNNRKDGWYYFVMPSAGSVTIEPVSLGGNDDMAMALYTLDPCANQFALIECDDDDGTNLMPRITICESAGTIIYVRLWQFSGNGSSDFTINYTTSTNGCAASTCFPNTPPITFNTGSGAVNTAPTVATNNVTICTQINFSTASGDWMDGIEFDLGSGWSNIQPNQAPNTCSFGGGSWIWQTNINPVSTCSPNNISPGYFFDDNGNGNGGDDFGDFGNCTFSACVTADLIDPNNSDISIFYGADDVYGSWSFGCNNACTQGETSYPPPPPPPPVGTCGLVIYNCVTQTLCDPNPGPTAGQEAITVYISHFGNINDVVNILVDGAIAFTSSLSANPYDAYTFYRTSDGIAHAITATFGNGANSSCLSNTVNFTSDAPCGCMVEIQDILLSCEPTPTPAPLPTPNPLNQFLDIGVDLFVNALPGGSNMSISLGAPGPLNLNTIPLPISSTNPTGSINTINNGPNASTAYWNFGTFGPLSADGLLAIFPNGILPLTFSLTDAGGNDLSATCTLPPAQNIVIPQIELIDPVVDNCTSTAQGSAFDVALTANLMGFDEMAANNIISFYNNSVLIPVSVNGGLAATTFDLSTLPAGTTSLDLLYSDIIYNDANSFSFEIGDGACNFSTLVNETDPSTTAILSQNFDFTIDDTPGNPFAQNPCACAITNLALTNSTPPCIGYGNTIELEYTFDIANPPASTVLSMYFTQTLDTIANPVFTKIILSEDADVVTNPNFQPTSTGGTLTELNFPQMPAPPAGVAATESYTCNLVIDFEYAQTTGLICSASIPFTVPGSCDCSIADIGTFTPASTPNGAPTPNQLVICPNNNIDFTSGNDFTPPAVAYEEVTPNVFQPIPAHQALGLVLIEPNTGQQILWDYQEINATNTNPPTYSIAQPLSIDNPANGTTVNNVTSYSYPTQDEIIGLFALGNDPQQEPLSIMARVVTIYNIDQLLASGSGNIPMLIPNCHINTSGTGLPYTGDIFAIGDDTFGTDSYALCSAPATVLNGTICGALTNDWELIFTPMIQVENITPDCPSSTITFDVHAGSYAFDWSIPQLNSANGPTAVTNTASNASPASFTYGDLTMDYVLDLTLEDFYGCQMNQTFDPFIAPIIGQVSWNEIGGNAAILPTLPNQTLRCGSDPNFQLVGQWEGTNANPQAGEWEIVWNGSTFSNPLTPYFNPGPGNIGPASAIDFNQLYTDLFNDGLLNTNTTLSPGNQPLYFSIRFNPTVASPGCSEWSDEYQIAFLDNFIPQAVLAPAGTSSVSKCLNEAAFDLSAIGGLPLNGIWHIGPIDPLTSTGAQDNIITTGTTFDLPNVPGPGVYEAYYDVSGVAGVQCPVLSNDFITITVHDTTDAIVAANLLEDCMPQGNFVLTNESDLINGTTNCEWYVDDVLQTNGDCNSIDLTLMMPKLYDITLIFTDFNGCITTKRYEDTLEVHPQPEVAFLYNPESVTMDDPEFQFLDNSTSPLVSYAWNFANYGSSTEPYTSFNFAAVTEPGSYDIILVGTDANQCSTEVTRQVMIEEGFVVFMPSSFTPDDDNLNEALRPVISGADRIRFYKFVVFDRWGNTVFETDDYKQWWIGDNASVPGYYVPNGAYQWRMEVILEGLEDRKIYKGAVTIIR